MKTLIITETEFHHGSKVSEAQSKINAILTNKRYYVIHLGIYVKSEKPKDKKNTGFLCFLGGILTGTALTLLMYLISFKI